MKSLWIIAVLITLLSMQGSVIASESRLLRSCEILITWKNPDHSNEDRYDAGFCLGYISGVYELNTAYQRAGKVEKPFFCAPEKGVTNGQNVSILINYLEDHPDKLQDGNLQLTLAAFMEAYPCEN